MNRTKLNEAVAEAYRFIQRAKALPKPEEYVLEGHNLTNDNFPKEQGAIRRASMDLSRALSELRKPD